jgi:hypothetical protein
VIAHGNAVIEKKRRVIPKLIKKFIFILNM